MKTLKPFALGLLGALLMLVLWHLWTDHQVYHELLRQLTTPRPAASK